MADAAGDPLPENPFTGMQINETAFLQDVQGRSPCVRCNKSRKFFCYGSGCYVPVAELTGRVPFVKVRFAGVFGFGRVDFDIFFPGS